jgi:carbamoylphosphate synthase large subunit
MENSRVVLIGAAGTGTAFGAACAIRRVWSQSVKLVVMDINPRHLVTASLLADYFEQVPPSASPGFVDTLLGILQRYSVDTYLPLLPEEIWLAARLHEEGRIPSTVNVMVPSLAASDACADKLTLSQLLSKEGLPVPRTAPASSPFPGKKFFLKPKNGTGSRGARPVHISELFGVVGESGSDWIVQEICQRPEVTVDAFFDPGSNFSYALCRERIEIKAGVSVKARLFVDEMLGGYARIIARCLHLSGSFCFQVMRIQSRWVVTDVNPRPGAATAMCAVVGNDFFAASFAYLWGEDFKKFFLPLESPHYVTRQYADFLMD